MGFFNTTGVRGLMWKGRKDAIVCLHGSVCDESRDTKTFPDLARVGALAYSRMLEMLK